MPFTDDWVNEYVERLNSDDELKLYARHFNMVWAIVSDDNQFIINATNGRFQLVEKDQDVKCALTLRATDEHWNNFISLTPVPGYTDLFGAQAHGNISIDGDIQQVWANIRVLWRAVELMRGVVTV